MIKYQLQCGNGHEFEGWFRSSGDFEADAAAGRLGCPLCADVQVRRAMMAPAVIAGRTREDARAARIAEIREAVVEAMTRARAYVEKNFEFVGDRFPEEARRIHYGETDERGIFGEATAAEARELIEEGIDIAPLPDPLAPSRAVKKLQS